MAKPKETKEPKEQEPKAPVTLEEKVKEPKAKVPSKHNDLKKFWKFKGEQ